MDILTYFAGEMDILLYIAAGAAVGFIVGITGVGGGALMTPLLLLFNFPPNIAIGTDLMFAAGTKFTGVWAHQRKKNISWHLVFLLLAGSIPAALVTGVILDQYFEDASSYSHVLSSSLGVMLILTALTLVFRKHIRSRSPAHPDNQTNNTRYTLLVIMGAFLGVFVTLSSVGAGAIGTAILMILFPLLPSVKVVGTDLAHAVPLTLVGGLIHVYLGNVDFALLGSLLVGSIPAIYLGTRVGTHLPERIMHPLLASMLLLLGCKFALFQTH